jgi:thiazole/oxazole-forming peptide maturase SagC family component
VVETKPKPRAFALKEGVRVFRSGEEIRFRKGVWNYNEAIVRLSNQEERVVRFFYAVYEQLLHGRTADAEAIGRETGASTQELESYCAILEDLKRQQYLNDPIENDAARILSGLLGGNLSGFEQYVADPRPVLFFADSDCAREASKTLARETGLPLDLIDDATLDALAQADLTTRTDAVGHVETIARFEKLFLPYSCVLGCVAAPNLSMLRNLNRLLIRAQKPLILGMIDGPFACLLATHATQTGCFECFEQRLLARLEDMAVYHQFVESTAGKRTVGGSGFAPVLHMLTAGVVSEGYLFSALGILRLAGRIINTYMPLLEIQVQDLLRVPYCPACGYIAQSQMNEMYTSSKRLLTDLLAKVHVED